MKKLQLNEESVNTLVRIKGKKLKSYEGEMRSRDFYFMNPIKLNLPRFSVELELAYVPLTWMSSKRTQETEDATLFNCKEVDSKQKPFGNDICIFPVEETISGVSIIRDYVGTNLDESFVFDSGIILTTDINNYSFVRYSIWDCAIYLKNRNEAETFYSISRVRNDLASILDNDLKINVKREIIVL